MEAATMHIGAAAGVLRHVSRTEAPRAVVLSTAELAECTCPDHCDRDHDRD